MPPHRNTLTALGVILGLSLLAGVPHAEAAVTFASQTKVQVQLTPTAVALGDLNGDGKPDAAVANRDSGSVSTLLATATGSLGTATNILVGLFGPHAVALGDLDGDGKLDLVVVKRGNNTVGVLLGDGTGGFGSITDFSTGQIPVAVALGDLNGDGNLDLAVVNSGDSPGTVSVRLGDGLGSFGAESTVTVGLVPVAVALGDLDGDGKLDLVVVNSGESPGTVSVLLGDGAGGFGAQTKFTVGLTPGIIVPGSSDPGVVALGDLNGGGKLDLVVANSGDSPGTVSVRLGDGLGSFGAESKVTVGSVPVAVALGDLDGDGKLDLVVVNSGESPGTVSVLLNTTSAGGGGDGGGGGASGSNNCFIATAAYGSPLAPQVQMLRDFRDGYLNPSPIGRTLVGLYYRLSPSVAQAIARSETARTVVRAGLTPVIWWAKLMLDSPTAGLAVLILASGPTVWLGLAIATRVRRRIRQPSRG